MAFITLIFRIVLLDFIDFFFFSLLPLLFFFVEGVFAVREAPILTQNVVTMAEHISLAKRAHREQWSAVADFKSIALINYEAQKDFLRLLMVNF